MSPLSVRPLAPVLRRTPWLRPLNDLDALDDWLSLVRPWWSISRIRARILETRLETHDTKTFVLKPNWRWTKFAAGQHVAVEIEIDGVRYHRPFSLSSGPADPHLALTVKRAGLVTGAMHDRLSAGDVVTLVGPAGQFVLPRALPERLLLIAAGIGITPLFSMLRDLAARRHGGSVVLVQVYRGSRLFAEALAQLAVQLPGLVIHAHDTSLDGRLSVPALTGLIADYHARTTFLCGPPAFMEPIRAHWSAERLDHRLVIEQFAADPRPVAEERQIHALRSGRWFTATGAPLLVDAEAAGLAPRHGCRVGVCQSCRYRKVSGIVEDLRSGRISAISDEMIQLCASVARSDLVLDL